MITANVSHTPLKKNTKIYFIKLSIFVESPLTIENGVFTWGEEEATLKDINIKVQRNSLVAVVGGVGSGMCSSLIVRCCK